MKSLRFVTVRFAMTGLGSSAPAGRSQSSAGARDSSSGVDLPSSATIDNPETKFVYSRSAEKMRHLTYVLGAFGPYPIVEAALTAGIDQADKTPPEWGSSPRRMESDPGPVLRSRPSRRERVTHWRKPSGTTRCITALSVTEHKT